MHMEMRIFRPINITRHIARWTCIPTLNYPSRFTLDPTYVMTIGQ